MLQQTLVARVHRSGSTGWRVGPRHRPRPPRAWPTCCGPGASWAHVGALGSDVLVVAGGVALVELVAAARLRTDRIPQRLRAFHTVDRGQAVRSADAPVQTHLSRDGRTCGLLKVQRAGRQIDQPGCDILLDDLL